MISAFSAQNSAVSLVAMLALVRKPEGGSWTTDDVYDQLVYGDLAFDDLYCHYRESYADRLGDINSTPTT